MAKSYTLSLLPVWQESSVERHCFHSVDRRSIDIIPFLSIDFHIFFRLLGTALDRLLFLDHLKWDELKLSSEVSNTLCTDGLLL